MPAPSHSLPQSCERPLDAAQHAQYLPALFEKRWISWERARHDLRERGAAEERVHDFRVATRRLMNLLSFLEALPLPGACGLRRRIKRRFDSFSRLREVQVLLLQCEAMTVEFPALQAFMRRLHKEEKRLLKAGEAQLRSEKTGALVAKRQQLRRALVVATAAPAAETLINATLLGYLGERAEAVLAHTLAMDARKPRTVHRLRLAYKRLRYGLEIASVWYSNPRLTALLRDAKAWQTTLGEIQDLSVLRRELGAFAKRGGGRLEGIRATRKQVTLLRKEAIEALFGRREALSRYVGRCVRAAKPGPTGRGDSAA